MNNRIKFKSLEDVLKALEKIESSPFQLKGQWDAYQHLSHCAQSLQLQLKGFPQENHVLFQETVGKLIFNFFKKRGYMNHDTNSFTPGTKPFEKNSLNAGIVNYKSALVQFLDWKEPYQKHAFFGKFSKQDIIRFHSMHFANHYEQFIFI